MALPRLATRSTLVQGLPRSRWCCRIWSACLYITRRPSCNQGTCPNGRKRCRLGIVPSWLTWLCITPLAQSALINSGTILFSASEPRKIFKLIGSETQPLNHASWLLASSDAQHRGSRQRPWPRQQCGARRIEFNLYFLSYYNVYGTCKTLRLTSPVISNKDRLYLRFFPLFLCLFLQKHREKVEGETHHHLVCEQHPCKFLLGKCLGLGCGLPISLSLQFFGCICNHKKGKGFHLTSLLPYPRQLAWPHHKWFLSWCLVDVSFRVFPQFGNVALFIPNF